MWILLVTVITTSFFDSLNPSAIAEQMLLQAMIKNKKTYLVFYFWNRNSKSHIRTGNLLRHCDMGFKTTFQSH